VRICVFKRFLKFCVFCELFFHEAYIDDTSIDCFRFILMETHASIVFDLAFLSFFRNMKNIGRWHSRSAMYVYQTVFFAFYRGIKFLLLPLVDEIE